MIDQVSIYYTQRFLSVLFDNYPMLITNLINKSQINNNQYNNYSFELNQDVYKTNHHRNLDEPDNFHIIFGSVADS